MFFFLKTSKGIFRNSPLINNYESELQKITGNTFVIILAYYPHPYSEYLKTTTYVFNFVKVLSSCMQTVIHVNTRKSQHIQHIHFQNG